MYRWISSTNRRYLRSPPMRSRFRRSNERTRSSGSCATSRISQLQRWCSTQGGVGCVGSGRQSTRWRRPVAGEAESSRCISWSVSATSSCVPERTARLTRLPRQDLVQFVTQPTECEVAEVHTRTSGFEVGNVRLRPSPEGRNGDAAGPGTGTRARTRERVRDRRGLNPLTILTGPGILRRP